MSDVQSILNRDVTFGKLEGHWLRSDGRVKPPPFERVLWFQAKMATRKARKAGWILELQQIPEVQVRHLARATRAP